MDAVPGESRTDEGLKSLTKVVRILDLFSTQDRTLSLATICQRTGYPRSTTHRLLASMRDAGLLDQDAERERYRLGMKLFELGNTVLANLELHREARPFVDTLCRLSAQAVHLAVFDGRRAIVIDRAEPTPEASLLPGFIESAPVHCTSVGKAILAFQPDAVVQRVTALGLERFTDQTLTDPGALRLQLAEIRSRGFSIDEGEHQPGLRCVGAPIRDGSGRVLAAISVSGPAWRLPVAEVDTLARMVIHQADGLSRRLGFRADHPG